MIQLKGASLIITLSIVMFVNIFRNDNKVDYHFPAATLLYMMP